MAEDYDLQIFSQKQIWRHLNAVTVKRSKVIDKKIRMQCVNELIVMGVIERKLDKNKAYSDSIII